ncbi:MAG: hypothetical protein V1797_15610 [Pseudomonadota bacterium]
MACPRIIRAAAARTVRPLNPAEFAREADVAPNPANRRLAISQASGLVHRLGPYHSNPPSGWSGRPSSISWTPAFAPI